ncbi:MAG: DegT/DnrJ/EryC1/StrS family aminotransferase [Candidatus Poribacteria bacterium]
MIPFLKPYFNFQELYALLSAEKKSIENFEKTFAKFFGSRFALSFSSGRNALYCVLKALDIYNSEIILPAYTCVVVAHAIVLSKNTPVFVDISLHDFNMDLDSIDKMLSSKTKAIIATSLFGYPIRIDKIRKICEKDILVIHDCALAPGVKLNGIDFNDESDVMIFSLNVRKPITALGGGMITTNNKDLYEKVKSFRDKNLKKYSLSQKIIKSLFFLSQFVAFNKMIYGFTDYLVNETHLLDKFLVDYSEDTDNIPEYYFKPLLNLQAKIGLIQLSKYNEMINKRREIAKFYYENLINEKSIILPPLIDGAVYSHYSVRVKNRQRFIANMRRKGISIGNYFDYCIPDLNVYREYKRGEYPNSVLCSNEVVNLPNHPGLSYKELNYIVNTIVGLGAHL